LKDAVTGEVRQRRAVPRPGPCAISACEPRQGRKAAALSRSWHVPQVPRVAVGRDASKKVW